MMDGVESRDVSYVSGHVFKFQRTFSLALLMIVALCFALRSVLLTIFYTIVSVLNYQWLGSIHHDNDQAPLACVRRTVLLFCV